MVIQSNLVGLSLLLPSVLGLSFPAREVAHRSYPKSAAKVAQTWYTGWHADDSDFPPEEMSWEKYNVVSYAFALTTPDPANITLPTSAEDAILRKVVKYGHEVGTKITISLGGGTGSQYFSTAVGNAANRTKFINAITGMVNDYDLDGVDFDWEYPGQQTECNIVSGQDSANLLELLKELRASPKLPKASLLTAAVPLWTFIDPDGNPMSDVSAYAKYLDWVEIMDYDAWGPWTPTAGPNAPLNDTCYTDPDYQIGSAVSGVAAWIAAGFPADQLVLGVASYGHGYNVTHADAFKNGKSGELNSSFPAFDPNNIPVGDAWDGFPGVDQCGIYQLQGGDWDFWGLITGGFLDDKGNVAKGIDYLYDTCSQTPTVYNATSQVWVEFDNAESFTAKGNFIETQGLRGFSMWEAGGDYNDILLDAIRSGSGMPKVIGGELFTTTRTYPTVTYPSTTSSPTTTSILAVTKNARPSPIVNTPASRRQRATGAKHHVKRI